MSASLVNINNLHAWGLPAIVSQMKLSIVGQTVFSRVGVVQLVERIGELRGSRQ